MAPLGASAQTSALVLVGERGAPEQLERARAGVIEVLAEQAVRLVPTPDGAPCAETECAARMALTTGADTVLLLELTEDAVRLTAVNRDGDTRSTTASLSEQDAALAAGAAAERLLESTPLAALGFLRVESSPPGIDVRIDGARAGTTPLRRSLPAGEHRIELTPSGRDPIERFATVTEREEASVIVDTADAEEDDAEEEDLQHTIDPATEASPWNWAIGGGLAVAGVVALISPLSTLARDGECTDRIDDVGCVEQVRIGAQTGILLGVGISALLAAVVVDVVAPIRVDVAASEESAAVWVTGSF
ncbi:MAG: PEGA domain-containing protein [Sandaracinaceae bacterium]